jgi:hypothetical protein
MCSRYVVMTLRQFIYLNMYLIFFVICARKRTSFFRISMWWMLVNLTGWNEGLRRKVEKKKVAAQRKCVAMQVSSRGSMKATGVIRSS